MKSIANVIAILFIIAGGVFFLQGIRVLPSAVMYGKTEWVIIGGVMVIVGAGAGLVVNRQKIRALLASWSKPK